MFRLLRNWLFVVILFLLLGSPLAPAKDRGKRGADNRPPGWDKGEKKGWQSDVPPGLEKKGELGKDEERLKGKAERTAEQAEEAREREQERVKEMEEMKERAKEEAQEQAEKEKKEAQRVKKAAEEKKSRRRRKTSTVSV